MTQPNLIMLNDGVTTITFDSFSSGTNANVLLAMIAMLGCKNQPSMSCPVTVTDGSSYILTSNGTGGWTLSLNV